ncbi:MAG TPA: glycosyltransferase [Ginsengibacter sp.]|nr:glycosyltransferase [Ginsengibacter sp.]
MSNKEILIILSPGFPESEADSTCLPMQQQFVRALKEMYPELDIVVLTFQYPYHQKKYKWFEVKVIPFGGRNKGGLQKLLLRNKINSTLKKLHEERKIAGLFSFWYNECAFIGKKFAAKYGVKHYCWILGQDARKGNEYPKLLPPLSNELVALSDFIQNEFERNHGINPQFVIPPGIDETLFDSIPKEKDIHLLGVGSLIPLKQYDIFLEVVAELKKQMPGIKVVLVGKGPEKEKLQSLISKFKLEGSVTMTGELPYSEVLKLMQRSKVFLHPSSYEGFSGVCMEALCAGNYVISFRQPMNIDIPHWHIAKNNGEMAREALQILQDPMTKYLSPHRYPISDCVKQVMNLFGVKYHATEKVV